MPTSFLADPSLVAVSPPPGEIQYGPRRILVAARDGFDFATLSSVISGLTLSARDAARRRG